MIYAVEFDGIKNFQDGSTFICLRVYDHDLKQEVTHAAEATALKSGCFAGFISPPVSAVS